MYQTLCIRKMPVYKYLRYYKEQYLSIFIKNSSIPSCINCIYFIKDQSNYPYEPVPNDKKNGKCKMFGCKDMITGEIEYDYAFECRVNEDKCGISGKKFEIKNKE
jgi:hypothetical protein